MDSSQKIVVKKTRSGFNVGMVFSYVLGDFIYEVKMHAFSNKMGFTSKCVGYNSRSKELSIKLFGLDIGSAFKDVPYLLTKAVTSLIGPAQSICTCSNKLRELHKMPAKSNNQLYSFFISHAVKGCKNVVDGKSISCYNNVELDAKAFSRYRANHLASVSEFMLQLNSSGKGDIFVDFVECDII